MVPELIQHDFTAAAIVSQVEPMLHDLQLRQTMQTQMAQVRRTLTPPPGGAIQSVAQTAAQLLKHKVSSVS
jgi:lipid A disaccharide synthetase